MNIAVLFGRRNLLKAAAVLGGLSTLSARTATPTPKMTIPESKIVPTK
jgi:hypothetical protein